MPKKSKPQVIFQSYNPYQARFPGLRVVSRETLHLIKILRSHGHKIVVEPDDGTKLCYLAQKGIKEFLSDPIIALTVNASLSFILSLVSNWVYDQLKRQPQNNELNLCIEIDESGRKVRYNHSGDPISDDRFQSILSLMNKRAEEYSDSLLIQPPDLTHSYPIYLEHTGQIVGWAKGLIKDDEGIKIDGLRITDEQTKLLIEFDKITGISVGGIIRKSTCYICGRDYTQCNHITGNLYNGRECIVHIDDILLAEFSLVKNPVQPLARIQKFSKQTKTI